MGVNRYSTFSEKEAQRFQKNFMADAILRYGSQERLANALCVSQQTISKYRDASIILGFHRFIRIARLLGDNEIVISWD